MTIDGFTPIYILSIYGLIRYFSRPKQSDDAANRLNWTPLESIGVGVFIYFASQILGGLVAYGLAVVFGIDPGSALDWLQDSTYGQFVLFLVIQTLTAWLLVTFLKKRRASLRDIGLKGRPSWQDLGYVVAGFFIYLASFIIVVSVLRGLIPALDIEQEQEIGFESPTSLQLPLVFISLVLLPAIVEELVVRGFLYSGLRQGMKKWLAALLASFLFAIAHLQAGSGKPLLWIAALDTFVLSMILIYIREKTGKLWAPIGLHMVKNSLAFISLYLAFFYR
jgi:membrane protease YdiL (CAAX protease family)